MSLTAEWEDVHRAVHWGTTPERHFVEFANAMPAASWFLEIGCGAGAQAVWLAEKGHSILAMDASQSAVDRVAKRMPKDKPNWYVFAGDVTKMSWYEHVVAPGFKLDCVLDVCCLQHLEFFDAIEVVQKARRWLRPGGWFWSKQVVEPFPRKLNRVSFIRATTLSTLRPMFDGYDWTLKMVNERVRADQYEVWHVIVEAKVKG